MAMLLLMMLLMMMLLLLLLAIVAVVLPDIISRAALGRGLAVVCLVDRY